MWKPNISYGHNIRENDYLKLSKQKKPHKKTKNDILAIYLEDEDEGKLGHDEDPVLGVDLVIRTRPSDSLKQKEVCTIRIISWRSKESIACQSLLF
jgi:hypothetical protein